MGLRIDLHVHTRRHSPCSQIDPDLLIGQAVRAGLFGVVITEHHYQWRPNELEALVERSGEPSFLLLAGFEYMTKQGDLLIYGLDSTEADQFPRGLAPEEAVELVHRSGGVCIAAHPTRAGMGFDERLLTLPVDAIEVQSVNLKDHEQRLALQLATDVGRRPIAASDAHNLRDVGRYSSEFQDPIMGMKDLRKSLLRGRFHPAGPPDTRVHTG